jgi:hypothetical protein
VQIGKGNGVNGLGKKKPPRCQSPIVGVLHRLNMSLLPRNSFRIQKSSPAHRAFQVWIT